MVKKGGTDDQHALGSTESLRHQPGDVLYLGLRPNGDIKPFLNHIHGPVCGLDEDRNLWMYRHVAGECMSQAPLRQQDGAAQANESRRFPAQFRHTVIGRLCSFDCRDASFKEALAGFGQRQGPSGALE